MTDDKTLIEFVAEIVEVGDRGVMIRRDGDEDTKPRRLPTLPKEEMACGRHLYSLVRVTVELIDDHQQEAKPR